MALGEAPEEFERLYQQLVAPYEPAVAGEDTRATGRISSNFKLEEQTWNVIENKGSVKIDKAGTWNVYENKPDSRAEHGRLTTLLFSKTFGLFLSGGLVLTWGNLECL